MNKDHISIKRAKKLTQKKYRLEYKMTLVEGMKIIRDISKKVVPLTVYVLENFKDRYKNFILEIKKRSPIIYLNSYDFNSLTSTKTTQGIIGVFPFNLLKEAVEPKSDKVFLLLHNQDPTNLGNIVRSAKWFGIDKLYLYQSVDPFNPRTIRASAGQVFFMNFFHIENINIFFENCGNDFKMTGITQKGNEPLSQYNFPEKAIFLFGSEGQGIPKEIEEKCHKTVEIEGVNRVESLNLQTAFSIFAYEYFKRSSH
ncbi:RNA methyltransferase [bacterium]|nr:RNA methyltransferase [bacterium]